MSEGQKTEKKIKEAARIIFMKKGYAGTRTRDIAEEAGINLALLNYYYRSKEKLFNQIMIESLTAFFQHIMQTFQHEESTLEEKFQQLAVRYIEHFKEQPDLPYFILNEMRSRPVEFVSKVSNGIRLHDLVIFQQLVDRIGPERAKKINPLHIMSNLMSLILFPFISKPMFKTISGIDNAQFDQLMEERKKLIPQWINQMLE